MCIRDRILPFTDYIFNQSTKDFNPFTISYNHNGITTTFVDPDDPTEFTKAVKSNTRAFFAESLGNPKLDVLDLKAISESAKKAKVPFIVDNTVASPALLNPIEHGANIVIHSLTKYLTGNGTSMGGVIIDAGTFNWGNGNFPEFTEPNPSYHGLNYHEALGKIAFIAKVRVEGLRDLGSAPSPFNSFQTIQGIETLDIRMKKHSEKLIANQNLNNSNIISSVKFFDGSINKLRDELSLLKFILNEDQKQFVAFRDSQLNATTNLMNFSEEAKGDIQSNRALLNDLKNENIKNGTLIKEIDKQIELLANQQDDNHKKTEALLAKIDSRLSLSFVLKAIVITLSLILMVFIWKYKHIITQVINSAPNQGKER